MTLGGRRRSERSFTRGKKYSRSLRYLIILYLAILTSDSLFSSSSLLNLFCFNQHSLFHLFTRVSTMALAAYANLCGFLWFSGVTCHYGRFPFSQNFRNFWFGRK